MRTLAVFVAVFGLALAQYRPQSGGAESQAEILKANSDVNPDGSYQWNYETSNGIQAQEQGQLTGNQQEPAIAAQGSYQYTAPDGTPIQTSYVADENGFQPQGAHLPVPPPIPEAILRAIAWNEAHPEPEQRPQGRF